MLTEYQEYLHSQNKAQNTIKSYSLHIGNYITWYTNTYDNAPTRLYRANILDYISYMRNVLKASARTINAKLSALLSYNEYLVDKGIQTDFVLSKKDNIKVQSQYANPSIVSKQEVEQFRQDILVNQGKRDYAVVTIMAYAGLRVSEVLNLLSSNFDFIARELTVNGKGDKQRIVFLNDKIIDAVKEYLAERHSDSEYLFVSRQGGKINRTRINQIFNQYSNKITPHTLRHFYCSNAIESGYSVHEVANQAGHSNIHTTLLYSNPSKDKMREKANLL